MPQIKKIRVDSEKISLAIQTGIPLTIMTYTLPPEMEQYIVDVLELFLEHLGQHHLVDSLSYCVKELVNNAKKANTKRVYFKLKNLDITNSEDYVKGMENFKENTINNIRYYLDEQRKYGFFIKVLFQMRNNKIKIEVRNRAELMFSEYKRIHDKVTRALQYDTVEQGMMELLDATEGAGLGIAILMLILRKNGFNEDNFQVLCDNGETICRVILPLSENYVRNLDTLSRKFVDLIEGLPEFPENITHIDRIISDPSSKMSTVAMQISNDVALSGELLKLVNSAAYFLSQPCQSIGDAVKIVGLRGIRNLLFSIGTMKNLMSETDTSSRALWEHSYKVAFYSYNLARNFCANDRDCIEDSYVSGLLHDMGKIIFKDVHGETLANVAEFAGTRGISMGLFEDLVAGLNHGEVGALLAEKWNFPDSLSSTIRYHHAPLDAPAESVKLASIVYSADMLAHYSDGDVKYDEIDHEVLARFNITTEAQLATIATRLTKAFNKNRN